MREIKCYTVATRCGELSRQWREQTQPRPDPAAFDKILKNLNDKKAPPEPASFDTLLKNLEKNEIDLVREQLRPCFNPPFDAKVNPELVADIRVSMNSDGTVREARVADMARYQSDPGYRVLADSGVRALRNTQCSPLRLPPDRYDLWRNFTFGVSARDLQ